MKLYCINILSLLLGFQGLPLSAVPHPRMHPMHLPHSRLTQAPCPPRPSPSWAVSSVPYTSTATGTSQVRPPLARAPRGLHQRHHSRAHHGHRSHPSCSLGLRSFRHHPLHSTALGRQPYLRRCTGRMGSLGPLPRGPRSRPRLSRARPWPATLRSQVRRAGAGGLPPGEWAVSQGSGRPSLTLQGGCLLNSVATVDERGTVDSHTALCASLRGSETAAC